MLLKSIVHTQRDIPEWYRGTSTRQDARVHLAANSTYTIRYKKYITYEPCPCAVRSQLVSTVGCARARAGELQTATTSA